MKRLLAQGVGHGQDRAGDDDGLDELRIELAHLERHHATVAEPKDGALLDPELLQARDQALCLERRRPLFPGADRATEEEEVRDIHGVLLR